MGGSDVRYDLNLARLEKLKNLNSGRSGRGGSPSSQSQASTSSHPSSSSSGITVVLNPAPRQENSSKDYMPVILYRAATNKNPDHFIAVITKIISADQGLNVSKITEDVVTPSGNTVLHVAASHGNKELAELLLLYNSSSLVLKQNLVGDTALHLAVRAGQEPLIHTILENASSNRILQQVRNREGNTALHEFVMRQQYYVSIMSESSLGNSSSAYSIFNLLINKDPKVCCFLNNEGKSPLYLAAEAGKKIFVKDMLGIAKNQIIVVMICLKENRPSYRL